MQWQLASPQVPQTLDALFALLATSRGLDTADMATFFHPPHPTQLTSADVAIDEAAIEQLKERLELAKQRKEHVVIFGDYDADGVCATAVMWEGLRAFGITATPFLPHREKHGYGLSLKAIPDLLAGERPDLVITVDNGIVAHAACQRLMDEGIDVLITDHHQPEDVLPAAQVIIHSPRLCGTTVSWWVVRQLLGARHETTQRTLDLTAIATIADQMPMLGVSRSFVLHGFHALRASSRVGLQLLAEKAQLELAELNLEGINYGIVPRINAMGRLKHGLAALQLLCTRKRERAQLLVAELHDTNTARQELTQEMVAHAMAQADSWAHEHVIIVHSPSYHEGVIGLIAGKLTESFSKPAIVLAEGDVNAKASARSIPGINIIELIREVRADLLEAGGHPMAAGFGVSLEKLPEVKAKLFALARVRITTEQLAPKLFVECQLPLSMLTTETAVAIQQWQPFGQRNPEPLFALKDLVVLHANTVGRENQHLKLQVTSAGVAGSPRAADQAITAMWWGHGERAATLKPGTLIDLVAKLQRSTWRGRVSLQLVVQDLHETTSS